MKNSSTITPDRITLHPIPPSLSTKPAAINPFKNKNLPGAKGSFPQQNPDHSSPSNSRRLQSNPGDSEPRDSNPSVNTQVPAGARANNSTYRVSPALPSSYPNQYKVERALRDTFRQLHDWTEKIQRVFSLIYVTQPLDSMSQSGYPTMQQMQAILKEAFNELETWKIQLALLMAYVYAPQYLQDMSRNTTPQPDGDEMDWQYEPTVWLSNRQR